MRPYSAVLLSRLSRHHVHSVRLSFLPQLRDKRGRDALRQQRLERGELGAFPFTQVPWSVAADAIAPVFSRGHRMPVSGWLNSAINSWLLRAHALAAGAIEPSRIVAIVILCSGAQGADDRAR